MLILGYNLLVNKLITSLYLIKSILRFKSNEFSLDFDTLFSRK